MSLIDIVVPCYNEEAGLIYLSMTVARTRLTLL